MSKFDLGLRKHEENGKVQYWLLVTAKRVESEEGRKSLKTKFHKKSFYNCYLQLIHAFYWRLFIICSIYFNILCCITFSWVTVKSTLLVVIILMHLTCFFYWIDFTGALVEKIAEKKLPKAEPRNYIFLTIDAISLIPLSTMYLCISKPYDVVILWTMRIITLLRFYQIPQFFSQLENIEKKRWNILIAAYASYFILLVILFANCFLYNIHDYKPIHIKDWNKTMTNKIVTSLYYALDVFLNVGSGDISPVSYEQIAINCAAMTIGCCAMMGLFNGILQTSYVIRGQRREHFRKKYEATMNVLKEKNVNKKVIRSMKDNFQTLWKYKEGFTEPPPVHILPLSLQKEIFFDINFGFLNRSIIFSMQPRSFLRSVSLLMKNVTYLPGEVIVESEKQFEAMICVASGVIEILSEENDESVLFSLTTGTILGEAKLFISIPSRCVIKASTYVEIQVLKKVSLARLALTYPQIYRSMRSEIYNRLQNAERIIEFEKNRVTLDADFKEVKRRKETKKFIKNLRLISKENLYEESDILSLYVLSENIPRVKTLPINLIRASPWILRPDTSLKTFWTIFISILILFSVLIHPLLAVFVRKITPIIQVLLFMTRITYIVDLYLECTTAIEKRDHFTYIVTIKEIIAEKLKTFTFYLDVLAAYYLSVYADLVWPEQSDYAYILLSLNSLLKTWRLIFSIEKRKNNIENILIIWVIVKYVVSFFIVIIWGASLLYLEACPGETCSPNRWFVQKEIEAVKNHEKTSCTSWPLEMSMYFATVILFAVGFGDIIPTTIEDCLVVTLCKIVGAILLIFCVAEISSTFTHLSLDRTSYQEEIFAVNRFVSEHEIPQDLQKKVQNYLRLQWDYDKGYSMKQTNQKEVLSVVQRQITMMSLTEAFFNVPLFRKANVEFVKLLAKQSKTGVLPPKEYIIEVGSIIREMYILENGYCQISNEKENLSKIIGPGFSFGFLEMILGTQQVINVQSLTHVKVISLDYISYLKAVTKYPNVKTEVDELIETDYKNPEHYYSSIFKKPDPISKESVKPAEQIEVLHKNFINVYKYYKNLKMSYWEPFRIWGKFRFFQFLIFPFVVAPDCLFLKIWTGVRIMNAVIITTVVPIQYCFKRYIKGLTIFLTTQQAFAALDMYLMFHVAYYNKQGLLMFHPAKTASHYLKGSFVLDLILVAPYFFVKYLSPLKNHNTPPNIYFEILGLIPVLQLYKFFQGCFYLEKNILRKTELIKILKFIPLSLLMTNFISGIFIMLECKNFHDTGNPSMVGVNRMAIEYKENLKKLCLSDENKNNTLDDGQIFKLYFTTFYWVTQGMTGCGFGDINPQSKTSMLFTLNIIILGIFFFTYKFASISSSIVNTNVLITKHRRRMLRMSRFMKEKNVRPALQKRFLLHFEHDWQRAEGATPQKVFTTVNAVLREKILTSMYEATIRQVPVFENMEKIIIKIIGKNLDEIYFLGGETIINYNDVQENIYLIYRGKVNLFSQNGQIITSMERGGLFGNISNKPFFLSSESVIAVENVDVLRLESKVFFNILKVFPSAKHLIDNLTSEKKNYIQPRNETSVPSTSSIIKLNLHFIQKMEQERLVKSCSRNQIKSINHGTQQYFELMRGDEIYSWHNQSTAQVATVENKKTTVKASHPTVDIHKNEFYLKNNIFKPNGKSFSTFVILPGSTLYDGIGGWFFGMAYLSVSLTVYSFAFQDLSTHILIMSYALDLIFLIEIFLQFHMSYFNKFGDCVISKKKIKIKYLKSKKIYLDIASNLPLDVLVVISHKHKYQLISIFRLNRIMRLYYLFKYYQLKKKNLMTNKIILQLSWIFIMATLMVHFLACILFIAVCPLGYWQEPTWVTEMNLVKHKKWELYIYSVHHILAITTSTGLEELTTYSSQELLINIISMYISRICVVLLTSLLVAAINAQSQNLFSFQEKTAELKTIFKRQNISEYIFEKMWNYLKFLWKRGSGKQMPKFISSAPYAMKCELMNEMFGSHLSQSYIFINTDEAFLRQLAIHLQRFVYFTGNYIVQQGDIDDTMYFIHKGEVSVLTIHPDLMETIHFVLVEKDSFGVRQGLIRGRVHNFSFRAQTDIEILSLTLSHWQYLLKYFPEVEKKINERLQSLPPSHP